jgi:hypothetical protein
MNKYLFISDAKDECVILVELVVIVYNSPREDIDLSRNIGNDVCWLF